MKEWTHKDIVLGTSPMPPRKSQGSPKWACYKYTNQLKNNLWMLHCIFLRTQLCSCHLRKVDATEKENIIETLVLL